MQSTVNNMQLFWELTEHPGEPLIMVHGSWVDHHNWSAVVPPLSHTFQVLTYDRRGHSRSERSDTPDSIHQDVADLAALIEDIDLAPAHIVGSSFGGSIALRLAANRPDLIRSLIVNEPPLLSLLEHDPDGAAALQGIRQHFDAIGKLLEDGDMEGGARQFVESIAFGPGAWDHVPSKLKDTVVFNAPTFLDELRDPEAYVFDLSPLSTFPQPVLLTFGEHGVPFMPHICQLLASVLPQAEPKMIPGADHAPQLSQPESFVTIIKEFISRVTSSR